MAEEDGADREAAARAAGEAAGAVAGEALTSVCVLCVSSKEQVVNIDCSCMWGPGKVAAGKVEAAMERWRAATVLCSGVLG